MLVQNKDEQEEIAMSNHGHHTGLVTVASSGLGFETAAQLADDGYERVIGTARSINKAASTKARLEDRTGKKVFETLVLDNDHLATVDTAVGELAGRNVKIDTLIMNAGIAPPPQLRKSADGFDAVTSSSLIGHHLLTMRLIEGTMLADNAHIVIAGSEAARGDVPTMNPVDFQDFAESSFDGNLEAAIEAQMYMREPATYKAGNVYATTKMFVAWWAAQLAKKLPEGMTVNAVSPGSTPGTDAIRNAPFYMKYFMVPLLKFMPGMSHSIEDGAKRYLEIAERDDVRGKFFASAPKRMIGDLTQVDLDHIDYVAGQEALWNTTVKVAGGVDYPSTVTSTNS